MDNYAYLRQAWEPMPKVTVLLSDFEFRRLDAFCRKRGFKKSTLLARLAREQLDSEGFFLQDELPLAASALTRVESAGSRQPRP